MSAAQSIREQLTALARLKTEAKAATGPAGYLIGAAYALLQATELGYRRGSRRDPHYAALLRRIARRAAAGSVLIQDTQSRPWLARFHFNSALHRLAAVADRLHVRPEPSAIRRVREEVNKLKHDIRQVPAQREKGLLEGRDVSMSTAVSALRILTRQCRSAGIL